MFYHSNPVRVQQHQHEHHKDRGHHLQPEQRHLHPFRVFYTTNFPSSKHSYICPPANIRLLPLSVSTYQAFRSLHLSHACEECSEGSLIFNYHGIVQYPDPGPCGGTSGSQVRSCPNHPNAKISILPNRNQEKSRTRKKTFKCNPCGDSFSNQTNLIFHMNRNHIKK